MLTVAPSGELEAQLLWKNPIVVKMVPKMPMASTTPAMMKSVSGFVFEVKYSVAVGRKYLICLNMVHCDMDMFIYYQQPLHRATIKHPMKYNVPVFRNSAWCPGQAYRQVANGDFC
jgi:hypothetical protein